MLIRALIVVLAILNAGVALWWWRSPPVSDAPVPAMSPPEGVPLLQLRAEQPEPPAETASAQAALEAAPASVPVVAEAAPVMATVGASPATADEPAAPAAAVCVSLGPFAERAALDQARARRCGDRGSAPT